MPFLNEGLHTQISLLSLSWTPCSFVTQKAPAILISPKATHAAALDEMPPGTASSDSLQSKVEKECYVGTHQQGLGLP